MGKLLSIEEQFDVLTALNHPELPAFKIMLGDIALAMADALRNSLNLASSDKADVQGVDEGGTMIAFYPINETDPLPAALASYDKSGDWEVYDGPYERLYPDNHPLAAV